jgi:NADH-quinone oxidoreductase subunit J
MEGIAFVVLASVLVFAALRVVTAESTLRSALGLILAQIAMSGLYVALSAPFIASLQILLYAGAVMVLFVFVIMLLNLGPDPERARLPLSWMRAGGVAAVGAVAVGMAQMAFASPLPHGSVDGSVRQVGSMLLHRFAFSFEAVSVILLTAVVGAVALSLKRLS